MILLDLSQVMISSVISQIGSHADSVETDLVRHMIINTIRSLRVKFSKDYGELIIACDDKKYWRRDIFPFYKANRKVERERSQWDWQHLFEALNTVKQELKENFPYRVIQVEGAEADDVIATLVLKQQEILNNKDEKILILSGDKDFIQLQMFENVKQYDPIKKRDIVSNDPFLFKEHLVLSGDRGDGIPNVLSSDHCIIEGIRQKPLRETKINEILQAKPCELSSEILRNWERNRVLIDLTKIPHYISEAVIDNFKQEADKTRSKMFNYFLQHKMKLLMESIGEF